MGPENQFNELHNSISLSQENKEKYLKGAGERLRLNVIKLRAFNGALAAGNVEDEERITQIVVVADTEQELDKDLWGETYFKEHFEQYFTE